MRKQFFLLSLIVVFSVCKISAGIPSVTGMPITDFGRNTENAFPYLIVNEDSQAVVVDLRDGTVFRLAKGFQGYNQIWINNTLTVANERWVLEYQQGPQWKLRGIPESLSWIRINDYTAKVTRHYTDYLGTSFNVTYDFSSETQPKITFKGFIGQVDTYRISWELAGIAKDSVQNEPIAHRTLCFNSGGPSIIFDYEDIYKDFGDITTVDTSEWAPGAGKVKQRYNVGPLPIGNFTLDPSFGRTDAVSGSSSNINDWIQGSYFTCPNAGTADSITAYVKSWNSNLKYAIYLKADDSFVGNTTEVVGPNGVFAWTTANFEAPKPSLSAATDYWLVAWSGDAGYLGYDATGVDLGGEDSEVYNGFPDPLNPAGKDRHHSIYCNYTLSGNIENFYGSVNHTQTINSLLSWDFTRYSSITQTFTINGLAQFVGLSHYFYGGVGLVFGIESFNNLPIEQQYQWVSEIIYGEGAWLGLLIILTIIFLVTQKNKDTSYFFIPVSFFIGLSYLTQVAANSLILWCAIIMFLTGFFLMINLLRKN